MSSRTGTLNPVTSTTALRTELVTTVTLTVHAAGDEPLLDLVGAHVVSTVYPHRVNTTEPPRVLATAVSSTGWTVHAAGSPHRLGDHTVLRSARALAVTSPQGDRQVIYVRGSDDHGPNVAKNPLRWLNQQDVQAGSLFAVHPADATVAPDIATDRAWRRVARVHTQPQRSSERAVGVSRRHSGGCLSSSPMAAANASCQAGSPRKASRCVSSAATSLQRASQTNTRSPSRTGNFGKVFALVSVT